MEMVMFSGARLTSELTNYLKTKEKIMGACDFYCHGHGRTPEAAFEDARESAFWEHGHGGYTGSIAEKTDFIMFSCPEGKKPIEYAGELIDNNHSAIDDKWGPAGCIRDGENRFLFFGWASS
jgi:hypothetical protein